MPISSNVSPRVHISESTHSISTNEDGDGYLSTPRTDRQRDDSGRTEGRVSLGQEVDKIKSEISDKAEGDFQKYALYMFAMKLIGERIYARHRQ